MERNDTPLVNRVAKSGLITLNLEDFYPDNPITVFDIKDYLFKEMILKEKDFRKALKEHDWSQYSGKDLLVYCSTDAIVPVWAYMLIVRYAEPHASNIFQFTPEEYYTHMFYRALEDFDASAYEDALIVVKGCGDKTVPPGAYMELTRKLQPYAKSIMYGEPCSTVPIYKKPREKN